MNISKKKYFNLTGKTNQFINIGYGKDITIKALTKLICKIANYNCKIEYDKRKPNGTFRKLIDSSKLKEINWSPKISLEEGIKSILDNY
jgi:GDP-L-fucose synthase